MRPERKSTAAVTFATASPFGSHPDVALQHGPRAHVPRQGEHGGLEVAVFGQPCGESGPQVVTSGRNAHVLPQLVPAPRIRLSEQDRGGRQVSAA